MRVELGWDFGGLGWVGFTRPNPTHPLDFASLWIIVCIADSLCVFNPNTWETIDDFRFLWSRRVLVVTLCAEGVGNVMRLNQTKYYAVLQDINRFKRSITTAWSSFANALTLGHGKLNMMSVMCAWTRWWFSWTVSKFRRRSDWQMFYCMDYDYGWLMTMDVCLCLYTDNYHKNAYLDVHAPFALLRNPHDVYVPFHSQVAFCIALRVGLGWLARGLGWVGFWKLENLVGWDLCGLGWVFKNGPTDNSDLSSISIIWLKCDVIVWNSHLLDTSFYFYFYYRYWVLFSSRLSFQPRCSVSLWCADCSGANYKSFFIIVIILWSYLH